MPRILAGLFLAGALTALWAAAPSAAEPPAFVGSKTCSQCHEDQYESFTKYSKKAHSWHSIAVMQAKLKPAELKQCFECHTTGFGRPGGFVSYEATPDLAQVGCETCHGPGSVHAASGDPKDIRRKPELATCQTCHNAQRIEDFRFKPLVYSGAH